MNQDISGKVFEEMGRLYFNVQVTSQQAAKLQEENENLKKRLASKMEDAKASE